MSELTAEYDVIIVSDFGERVDWLDKFTERQIIPVSRLDRLVGRRIRNAYYTSAAARMPAFTQTYNRLVFESSVRGGKVLHAMYWEADEVDVMQLIAALPEANATTGRDWGRGYSQAIKDVMELLAEQAVA